MEEEFKQNQMVSVFAPRVILGEEIEPFCVPTSGDTTSQMIAAATNLIWWAMHEALADGKNEDATLCGKMLLDVVGRELSPEQKDETVELIAEVFEHYKNPPELN